MAQSESNSEFMLPHKFYQLTPKRMRSPKGVLRARSTRGIGALAVLMCWAGTVLAQHTAVAKNGVGGRIETDFDAADKATEMRTIGPDGKLQQKVNYEYLPGYYGPQQTDTTYWPNGNLRKVSRHTYDESTNFTGEFIQVFDETGQQVSGHKLTHDPLRGTYRCAEWNAAAHDYRAALCPSGEEEGSVGGGGSAKKFTYDEVMKHLELARKDAAGERAGGGAAGSAAMTRKEVGLVLPAHFYRGGRISGMVVRNPEQFEEMPGVTVTRIRVPFESGGDGALAGWRFEARGEEPQAANGPVTFIVPAQGSLTITLRQGMNAAGSVSKELNFSNALPKKLPSTPSFEAPALCMKEELCVVSGGFSGDSSKDFAAFEDRAATVVAETEDAAYIAIPEATEPGARPLFIAEGSGEEAKVVAFPVAVGRLSVRNNGREVQAGETVITFPMLEGASGVADPVWEVRDRSKSKMERARQLVPGFSLNGELCEGGEAESNIEREAEEKDGEIEDDREVKDPKEKDDEGKILVVLKNRAPDATSLHGSTRGIVALCLGDEAFQRGDFKYDLRIDASKAGKIAVKGSVISFLAPVAGQELRVKEKR